MRLALVPCTFQTESPPCFLIPCFDNKYCKNTRRARSNPPSHDPYAASSRRSESRGRRMLAGVVMRESAKASMIVRTGHTRLHSIRPADHECTHRRKVHSNHFLDVVEAYAALPGHDTRLPLSVCEGRLERTPWSNEPHRVLAHHVIIRLLWVRVQGNRITPLTCVVQFTRRDKAHQGVRCERDMIGRLSLDKSTRRCVRQ